MGDSGGSQGLEEHDGATPLRSLERFQISNSRERFKLTLFSLYLDFLTLLLLEELGELALNDEEEGALIEIMTCAIKRAAGEDPPPGRGKPRQR